MHAIQEHTTTYSVSIIQVHTTTYSFSLSITQTYLRWDEGDEQGDDGAIVKHEWNVTMHVLKQIFGTL